MVGYMKRYDPAYEELAARLDREPIRFARVTTLEPPLEPYVAHYPLRRGAIDPDVAAALAAEDERKVDEAVGDLAPHVRRVYRSILLDSMIHELNAVRGLLGEPDNLLFADIWGEDHGVTATMRYGDTECVFSWIDLPGIARYEQELAFFAPDARARLTFPSPFLRSMPTQLVFEGGSNGSSASWRSEHVASYEEAFKRELVELHAAIAEERDPRTPGSDGLRDVVLCRAIATAVHEGRPRFRPTELEAS
jgi:predicted dehydrogenase